MSVKKNYIGTELYYKKEEAERLIRCLEFIDTMHLISIKEFYEKNIGKKFSKETLNDIVNNGIVNIKHDFLFTLEEQLKKAGFTIQFFIDEQKKTLSKTLHSLEHHIDLFHGELEIKKSRELFLIDIIDFVNDEGRIVIDDQKKELIRKMYTITIKNENQSDVYNDFVKVKRAVEKMIKNAKKKGISIDRELIVDGYREGILLNDLYKKTVKVNPYFIDSIQ